jgi:predicted GH43/DUF377 family glycosyl hydrolase
MKKTFTFLVLCTIVRFIPGSMVSFAQVPPEFEGSLFYSPVVNYGYQGTWDAGSINMPSVYIFDGTFYMFFTGFNAAAIASIGLATSSDGYVFEKYEGNPVLTRSSGGFDSYHVARAIVTEYNSGWVMYYGARQLAGFGPGPYIGMATATDLTGPWEKSTDPVLTVGSPDEWDNGFIGPNQVFPLDSGGFIMFYEGGDYTVGSGYHMGMAISEDGIEWTKYDNPETTDPPFAESDPVLKHGITGAWDERFVWLASIQKTDDGYEMYYTGGDFDDKYGFGYATSPDGINWTKYPDNPVFTVADDPYALEHGFNVLECPAVVYSGTTAFMYYDYGVPNVIGMATAELTGVGESLAGGRTPEAVVGCYPNPTHNIVDFRWMMDDQRSVSLRVYNAQGQEVATVLDKELPAGEQNVRYDMSGLPAGIYYYRLSASGLRPPVAGLRSPASGKIVKY